MFCIFFVLYMYSVRIYSQGCVLSNKEVRGACRLTSGLEAKFGVRSGQVHKIRGKIWEVLSPKRHKSWEKVPILGSVSEIQRAKFGVFVIYIFGGKFEAPTRISEAKFGAKPPRPPNMEVPPWEFTSGVKDMTFVLTYT